jgi:sulfonate transport system substrate-binding protein
LMRITVAAFAFAMMAVSPSLAQTPPAEKPDIALGVGGKSALYYLQLTLTERLGYFKEQGLNVTISDFAGGAKSLQSLIGGSSDVVTGAYEHTIRMQAKGQPVVAVIEMGRFPGIVVALRKDKAGQVKSFKDFKGLKVGVTAPGSSTNFIVDALIAKEGLKPDDISPIGVGTGLSAVAAIKKGEIDAISNIDPVITKLERDGDVVVMAETRTEQGNMKWFGGNNPAAVLYLKQEFIDKNPNTVQRLVNAFYKTMKWLEHASEDDIAKNVPEEYFLGDRALYMAAVKASRPMYSTTGIIPPKGMQNALDMLRQFDPELKDAKIDLSKTFDDRFVKKAAATM